MSASSVRSLIERVDSCRGPLTYRETVGRPQVTTDTLGEWVDLKVLTCVEERLVSVVRHDMVLRNQEVEVLSRLVQGHEQHVVTWHARGGEQGEARAGGVTEDPNLLVALLRAWLDAAQKLGWGGPEQTDEENAPDMRPQGLSVLAESVAPGPWEANGPHVVGPDGDGVAECRGNLGIDSDRVHTAEDTARFVAAARQAAPALASRNNQLAGALCELVRLKNIKERIEASVATQAEVNEYTYGKEPAWASARAILEKTHGETN